MSGAAPELVSSHHTLALGAGGFLGRAFFRCRVVTLVPAMPPCGLFSVRKQTGGRVKRHERPGQAYPATFNSRIFLRGRLGADETPRRGLFFRTPFGDAPGGLRRFSASCRRVARPIISPTLGARPPNKFCPGATFYAGALEILSTAIICSSVQ